MPAVEVSRWLCRSASGARIACIERSAAIFRCAAIIELRQQVMRDSGQRIERVVDLDADQAFAREGLLQPFRQRLARHRRFDHERALQR